MPADAPGEILREILRTRGMTQADLARRMGRPAQIVSEIITGKKTITADTAVQLEQALGISAPLWLHLETDYRLHLARIRAALRTPPEATP